MMHVDPAALLLGRDPDNIAQWYVVEAKPGTGVTERAYLSLVTSGLKAKMFLIAKRPPNRRGGPSSSNVQKVKSGEKRSDSYMPRFGRYFFVKCRLTDDVWAGIHMVPGVRGILRSSRDHVPVPLPEEIIRNLEEQQDDVAKRVNEALFVVGDVVRIIDGPFATFNAVVRELDGPEVLILDVEIFGRATPYPLRFNQVEMLQPAKSRAISALRKAKAKASSKVRSIA